MKKAALLGGVLILAVLAGIGYLQLQKNQNTFMPKQEKLVVGTDATYPPLEYMDEKKEIIGFDIDLAKELAKNLNVELEVRNISFDTLFSALKKGEIDMVISSVTITQEREKEMLFSSPYLNAGQIIVTKKTNSSVVDTRSLSAITVGVQKDTTSETEAKKYTTKVKTYVDYDAALKDLKNGMLGALIIDYPAAVTMVQSSRDTLKIVGSPFTSEFYGIAIAQDNTDLATRVNEALAVLKRENVLSQLEAKWFTK